MKQYFKKFCAATILCTILGLPIIVFAASYTSSFNFDTTLTGSTRSFNGSNINLKTVSKSSGHTAASSRYFTVALYRKNTIGSSYVGEASFLRDGTSNKTWTNVGSGKYYFYFSKGFDGRYVKGTATMYN